MNVGEAKAALRETSVPSSPNVESKLADGSANNVIQFPEQRKTALPNGGKWARYAGKLGCAATVGLSAAAIRKGGHEPNEPDEADVRLLEDALEEGLRLQYGDREIPWWLGAALAAGGVYAGMRIGAPKLVTDHELTPSDTAAAKIEQQEPTRAPIPDRPKIDARFSSIIPKPIGQ